MIKNQKEKRIARVRGKLKASVLPKLSVFRSNKHIWVQVILGSKTLAAASSKDISTAKVKSDVAKEVGKLVAQKALAQKIKDVVFDRGSYKYHGRVKALAEGAREGGLIF